MGDTVEVTWLDAWCDHDTTDGPQDWKDECRVKTYGTLVRATDSVVSVAEEVVSYGSDSDSYRCVTHVPRGMVVPGGIVVLGRPA